MRLVCVVGLLALLAFAQLSWAQDSSSSSTADSSSSTADSSTIHQSSSSSSSSSSTGPDSSSSSTGAGNVTGCLKGKYDWTILNQLSTQAICSMTRNDEIGANAEIGLVIYGGNTTNIHKGITPDRYKRLNHVWVPSDALKTDVYTKIEVTQTYDTYLKKTQHQFYRVIAEMCGVASPPRSWVTTDESGAMHVVPFLTLIVELKKGAVQSLSWDDNCYGCTSSCLTTRDIGDPCAVNGVVSDAACSVNLKNDCTNTDKAGAKISCDLNIYVAFIGTDSNGDYCLSSGMRVSRFRRYSVNDAYNNAASKVSTFDQAWPAFWTAFTV